MWCARRGVPAVWCVGVWLLCVCVQLGMWSGNEVTEAWVHLEYFKEIMVLAGIKVLAGIELARIKDRVSRD
jgi:hypothetical protein